MNDTTQHEPLWSDYAIDFVAAVIPEDWRDDVKRVLKSRRDDYEARLAETESDLADLRARIAELETDK